MKDSYPKFITVEGIDGSGKTTIIPFMVEYLKDLGYKVVQTRDPGSTPLGNQLRQILLNTPMSIKTELKLFDTIRQDMIDNVIKPNVRDGLIVISDRYVDSTFAYQGFGRGLLEEVTEMYKEVLLPVKTILLDISVEESVKRMKARTATTGEQEDRFDAEKLQFKQKLYEGYHYQADKHPNRIDKIDASGPIEQVKLNVAAWLDRHF